MGEYRCVLGYALGSRAPGAPDAQRCAMRLAGAHAGVAYRPEQRSERTGAYAPRCCAADHPEVKEPPGLFCRFLAFPPASSRIVECRPGPRTNCRAPPDGLP